MTMTDDQQATYTAALNANNLLLTRLTGDDSFALVRRMDSAMRQSLRIGGSEAEVCRRAREDIKALHSAERIADAYGAAAFQDLSHWTYRQLRPLVESVT